MERYSIDNATRKIRKPMDQIKDVMRYSDIEGVSINKWRSKDKDGKPVDRFSTSIHSRLEEEFYSESEEEE